MKNIEILLLLLIGYDDFAEHFRSDIKVYRLKRSFIKSFSKINNI